MTASTGTPSMLRTAGTPGSNRIVVCPASPIIIVRAESHTPASLSHPTATRYCTNRHAPLGPAAERDQELRLTVKSVFVLHWGQAITGRRPSPAQAGTDGDQIQCARIRGLRLS